MIYVWNQVAFSVNIEHDDDLLCCCLLKSIHIVHIHTPFFPLNIVFDLVKFWKQHYCFGRNNQCHMTIHDLAEIKSDKSSNYNSIAFSRQFDHLLEKCTTKQLSVQIFEKEKIIAFCSKWLARNGRQPVNWQAK